MEKNIIIAIVLGILVLVSFVQAIQLNSLKEKITDAPLSVSAKSTSTPAAGGSGGSGSVPSNIQNLPQMVGGC